MDPSIAVALIAFLIVAATVAVVGAAAFRLLPGVRRDRLVPGTVSARRDSILRFSAPQAWWQRFVEAVGRRTGPREAGNISKLRQRLGWAGYHSPNAGAIYTGSRFVLAVVLGVLYPLLGLVLGRSMPNPLLGSLAFAYIGFFLPAVFLRHLISSRQDEITRALPDFLDLLTVCVEAGMSFESALARISEQPEARRSAFHQEIVRMNLEVGAGRPRTEALRAFGARCGVQDVTTMVSVFVQTERLGTSMGRALRAHSDTARTQRRHRLEAQAYLAPLKMIFPTMIFLTPAFFLVALAPSLLGFLAVLRSFGK